MSESTRSGHYHDHPLSEQELLTNYGPGYLRDLSIQGKAMKPVRDVVIWLKDEIGSEMNEEGLEEILWGCAPMSIITAMGPSSLYPSEALGLHQTQRVVNTVLNITEREGLELIVPNTSHNFTCLMEQPTTRGALVFIEGRSSGHLIGIRPVATVNTKLGSKEELRIDKQYYRLDFDAPRHHEPTETIISWQDLPDYYARSPVDDDNQRLVWVFGDRPIDTYE